MIIGMERPRESAEETRERLALEDPRLSKALLSFRPLCGVPGVLLGVSNDETGELIGDFQLSPDQARGAARSLELMLRIQDTEGS